MLMYRLPILLLGAAAATAAGSSSSGGGTGSSPTSPTADLEAGEAPYVWPLPSQLSIPQGAGSARLSPTLQLVMTTSPIDKVSASAVSRYGPILRNLSTTAAGRRRQQEQQQQASERVIVSGQEQQQQQLVTSWLFTAHAPRGSPEPSVARFVCDGATTAGSKRRAHTLPHPHLATGRLGARSRAVTHHADEPSEVGDLVRGGRALVRRTPRYPVIDAPG